MVKTIKRQFTYQDLSQWNRQKGKRKGGGILTQYNSMNNAFIISPLPSKVNNPPTVEKKACKLYRFRAFTFTLFSWTFPDADDSPMPNEGSTKILEKRRKKLSQG